MRTKPRHDAGRRRTHLPHLPVRLVRRLEPQAVFHRVADDGCVGGEPALVQDATAVSADGLAAEAERSRDLAQGAPRAEHAEHLVLPMRQRFVAGSLRDATPLAAELARDARTRASA